MPLILVPYTFGSDQTGPPAVATGGGYFERRKRFVAWLAVLVIALIC